MSPPHAETTDKPARPRVVKRYANRKLYDTRDSRYVTLQQIAEFVRGGEDVTIIDNTTKEDLTHVTLAQIVYEEERKGGERSEATGRAGPSVGTLRSLIQHGGEKLFSTLREITPAAAMGKLIRRDPGDSPGEGNEPAAPRSEDGRLSVSSPKQAWDELQRLADDRIKGVLGHAIGHVQQLQGEVKRLQGRIEDLEQKLVALSAARGSEAHAAAPGAEARPSADSEPARGDG